MTDLRTYRTWMDEGTAVFLDQLDRLPDEAISRASALPDWTIGHVAAHVGHNAVGLARLVHWARTGVETPMYVSDEARDADITAGATLPPAELRTFVRDAADRLGADLEALPESAWTARLRTRRGEVAASEIPWLRGREVWIHAVDLGTGVGFADFPAPLLDELITDIVGARGLKRDGAAVVIADDGGDPVSVRGSAAEVAGWLAGRAAPGGWPELPAWL